MFIAFGSLRNMTENDGKKRPTARIKQKKSGSSIKKWRVMLVVFSGFFSLYMIFISIRLSSSSSSINDQHHRQAHLEEFRNKKGGNNTKTKEISSPKRQREVSIINEIETSNSKSSLELSSSKFLVQSMTNNNTTSLPITNPFIDSYFTLNVPPSDGTNLWDNDDEYKIPQWAKVYFNWHKHKRTTWNLQNYTSERWLIMQCLADQDQKCGGTADRLKPLPLMLRMAYNTRRILLIRWTRPATLESFLVPPKAGFDWRVPEEMANTMSNSTNGKRLVPSKVIERYALGDMPLIRTRYQSYNGGSAWYNNQTTLDHEKDEPQFDDIFHNIWRIFFRPSPPVAQRIQDQLNKMNLIPGHYASAHLRALYAIESRDETVIHQWTENALNCASGLRPGMPIFFASDSSHAAEYSKIYGLRNHSARVETHTPDPNPPLHLDKCKDWKKRPPQDFFDTFVDLYLLALGGCVTYGKGGYGHWGLLIGINPTCFVQQDHKFNGGIGEKCSWHDGAKQRIEPEAELLSPLFLEVME